MDFLKPTTSSRWFAHRAPKRLHQNSQEFPTFSSYRVYLFILCETLNLSDVPFTFTYMFWHTQHFAVVAGVASHLQDIKTDLLTVLLFLSLPSFQGWMGQQFPILGQTRFNMGLFPGTCSLRSRTPFNKITCFYSATVQLITVSGGFHT
ncbi:hypothetical protein AMECASPLE_025071 [Ameca splendens]|uniref:Uncharacterized protein n=1 Tax=Ameca splendens TaxID=208324 RepID=A0ABV0YFY7_9TELE